MFTSDFDFTLLESGNTVLKLITFISEEFKKKNRKKEIRKKGKTKYRKKNQDSLGRKILLTFLPSCL